jgi:DNA-directed RNA polymerase subunit M/transcription elongation factor TFIIS
MDSLSPLRLQTYSDLKQEFPLNGPNITELEAFIYKESCSRNVLHGPDGPRMWTYSTGTSLYATERHESHVREMVAAYLTNVVKVKELIYMFQKRRGTLVPFEDVLTFLKEDGYVHEQQSDFAIWKQAYEEEQQKIKKTLEQRETISSGSSQHFIKCRKCKSDHVDVEQKQTRSADEPMTLFCQCRQCGTRFVMH